MVIGTPVNYYIVVKVAVTAGGGPHHLRVVLEGESLLNDATSITLFLVFLKEVQGLQSQANPPSVGAKEFGEIVRSIIWLSVGEVLCIEIGHSQCWLPFTPLHMM